MQRAIGSNPRFRWLLLYLAWLFAFLPFAPSVWRAWLFPRIGAYVTLDIIHVGEYVILGWLLCWSRWRGTSGKPWRAIALLAAIALLDELAQGLLPNRFADARDWLCDWLGGGLGMAGEWLWRAARNLCYTGRTK